VRTQRQLSTTDNERAHRSLSPCRPTLLHTYLLTTSNAAATLENRWDGARAQLALSWRSVLVLHLEERGGGEEAERNEKKTQYSSCTLKSVAAVKKPREVKRPMQSSWETSRRISL